MHDPVLCPHNCENMTMNALVLLAATADDGGQIATDCPDVWRGLVSSGCPDHQFLHCLSSCFIGLPIGPFSRCWKNGGNKSPWDLRTTKR